ncbi:hypothetical protein [Phocaeicola salanitronis]|uniref:hypothetical protein n=1 Tax=Phocaeicola salanitronis TaxID=376805 RepID=UPI0025A33D3B|nr:hypothetical protein [Phocaeicola salanitronis]MDM8305445.1 hypothetical protein [Phocaeicola salanitronis]
MQKIVKSALSFVVFALTFVGSAMGQTQFEQSQARIIEPKQDVFIKPLVAEIVIMNNQVRQDYGPYEFEIQSVETLTFELLENIKTRALYRAMKEANADIIVAATFNARSDEKGKRVMIELSGFPGKYVNFRTASKQDNDYEWITTVYPYTDRINTTGKTKALGN